MVVPNSRCNEVCNEDKHCSRVRIWITGCQQKRFSEDYSWRNLKKLCLTCTETQTSKDAASELGCGDQGQVKLYGIIRNTIRYSQPALPKARTSNMAARGCVSSPESPRYRRHWLWWWKGLGKGSPCDMVGDSSSPSTSTWLSGDLNTGPLTGSHHKLKKQSNRKKN